MEFLLTYGVSHPFTVRIDFYESNLFRLLCSVHDFVGSIHYFRTAAESSTGPPKDRFEAALHWARLSPGDMTSSVVPAYKQVMRILPQLVWLGTPVEIRYDRITDVAGIVSTEAASAAIASQEYSLALEWLEEGRSIVWKQMLQLRTPIDDLAAVEPTLATELKEVARDLDYASSPKSVDTTVSPQDMSLSEAARDHHRLAERWQELVDRARGLPGFHAFLRPQNVSELLRSAQSGSVVVINIHESRCDALAIHSNSVEISHIPLNLTLTQVMGCRSQMVRFVHSQNRDVRAPYFNRPNPKDEFRSALGVLWKDLVKPILDALGLLVCSIISHPPCYSSDLLLGLATPADWRLAAHHLVHHWPIIVLTAARCRRL